MALSKQPHRLRSSSDPFSDPPQPVPTYSAYGVPTLSKNAPPQQHRAPPPVPPKARAANNSTTSRSHTKPTMTTEVVTTSRTTEHSPRTRMGRSQTQMSPYVEIPVMQDFSYPDSPPVHRRYTDPYLLVPPPLQLVVLIHRIL